MPRIRRIVGRCLRAVPPAWRLVSEVRARRAAASIDPTRPERLPVLVYQMGKVGSATVVRTLETCPGLERPVIQVHHLVPREIDAVRAFHRRGRGGPVPERLAWRQGRAVGARLAELGSRVRVPVISLVRDPIARELSAAFQDPRLFASDLRDARGNVDVARATAFLRARFDASDPCGYAEQWFAREPAVTLGIDVFEEPFDRDRGHQIVRSRRADLLLLRTEDLDRTLPQGASELLGIEIEDVSRANERLSTPDGDAYREVVERFRLPRGVVERIYAGRLARHFYGKDWIERFVARWSA